MQYAPRPRLSVQAGLQAAALVTALAFFAKYALLAFGVVVPWSAFVVVSVIAVSVAGLFTAFYTEFAVARRIDRVVRTLERQAKDGSLTRLPHLGDDEIGRIARAVNEVLANLTSLEVQMIEQDQELMQTRDELQLKEALAVKSAELEQRLRERALLFDIMRASASERELNSMLLELANRLGFALQLREFVLLLADDESERLTVRAASGFDSLEGILERIILYSEGPMGNVVRSMKPLVLHDLIDWEGDSILWDLVEHRGSMVMFPIVHRGSAIGVIAATRSEPEAFSDLDLRLFAAIADQLGVAIKHAQMFDELRRGSNHDDLTGLGNRRLLRARLEDELLRAQRFNQRTSLLALDIDHFKKLNDRCGHPTGDASLRKLAGLMTRNLRRIDTIARIGGEEFVVLLPRTGRAEARQVGEKLRVLVEQTDFPGGEGQPDGRLTVSIGVATLNAGESAEELIARADAALYTAKADGRNRVVIAGDEPQPEASVRSLTRSRI